MAPSLAELRRRGSRVGDIWAEKLAAAPAESIVHTAEGLDDYLKSALDFFKSETRLLIADGTSPKAAREFFESAASTFRRRLGEMDERSGVQP